MTGRIICLGSPLIDIIAKIDASFLEKYNLKPDNAIAISESTKNIFNEIAAFKPDIHVGGSITNTTRILKWLLKDYNYIVSYYGSVGQDEYAEVFKKKFEEENIKYVLKNIEGESTGRVAVLAVNTNSRCMITDLGASRIFNESDYKELFYSDIDTATCLYFSGFFFNVNRDLIQQIVKTFLMQRNQVFFNLGAPFIISKYKKDILHLCVQVDIVFGNESEFKVLTDNDNLEEGLLSLTKLIKTCNTTFVITRGPKSVLSYNLQSKQLQEYKFDELTPCTIKDADGAGDAFVGGFLAQFLIKSPIEVCVACGVFAAKEILKHTGCNFDRNVKFSCNV